MKYGIDSKTYVEMDSKEHFEKDDYGNWNWYYYK
jgi:hypothetical protein